MNRTNALSVATFSLIFCFYTQFAFANSAPTTQDTSVIGIEDEALQVQLSGNDSDGDTLTFSIVSGPQNGVLSGSGDTRTYTPDEDFFGADSFSFSASDGQSVSGVSTVYVDIAGVNDAPELRPFAMKNVTSEGVRQGVFEDIPISVTMHATDAEGDDVSYFVAQQPVNGTATINGNVVTYLSNLNYFARGSDSFYVTAFDGQLYSRQAYVVNRVQPINDAPEISSVAPIDAAVGSMYEYQVTASDVDSPEAELSYELVTSLSGMTINDATGLISWVPTESQTGINFVSIKVSDAGAPPWPYSGQRPYLGVESVVQDFNINVVSSTAPILLADIAPQTTTATQPFTLQLDAQSQNGSVLSYTLDNSPVGLTIDETTGLISWTPQINQVGQYTITGNISDQTNTLGFSFDITIEPIVLDPPEFIGETSLIGFIRETFTHTLQITAQTNYTLELISGPAGLTLDDDTGAISWDETLEGETSFQIKATISENVFSTQIFQLNIIDKEPNHEGSDFWLAFGMNADNKQISLLLYVSSQTDTQGMVDVPLQGISIPFSVSAGVVERIELPTSLLTATNNGITSIFDSGIHVTTEDKVVLYALNQRPNSTDGFLVLPTDTLGLNYRAMTYDGGQVYYIATEDDTTVDFTFSEEVILLRDGGFGDNTKYIEGQVITEVLQAGQVSTLEANLFGGNTTTGSSISSDKPIAAFSGNNCVNVPSNKSACDHLVEQLPATKYWGATYYTKPLAKRFGGDIFRIVADFDDTQILVNEEFLGTLNAGEWIEDTFTSSSIIQASHPVLVAQFSKGASVDFDENQTLGDPAMIFLTPTEQFTSRYQFTTTDQGIEFNFVNVIATQDAISTMTLDGEIVDATEFSIINNSGYFGAQIQVTEGAHLLESDTPFGASIYGFGEFDSYGYQGGTRLPRYSSISEISLDSPVLNGTTGLEACVDIQLTNADLPIINSRVDVFTQSAANAIYHYFTDEIGKVQHCHIGLTSFIETLDIRSGDLTTTAEIQWTDDISSNQYAPQFTSTPITYAKVGSMYSYFVETIDANQSDTVTLEVMSAPDGMMLNGSILEWQPIEADVGRYPVEVKVTDNTGLETIQSFNIVVYTGNAAPIVTAESDTFVAYVGFFYKNRLTLSDPDGDIIYCEMLDNPLYGARSYTNGSQICDGILTNRFLEDDIGIYPISLRFFDRTGGETFFNFDLEVKQNHVPELVSLPDPYAKVGTDYISQLVASDPDGDEVSYQLNSVRSAANNSIASLPNQRIDAQTGVFSFTPTVGSAGVYDIEILARDVIQASSFTFRLTVSLEDEPFDAQLTISPQFASAGETIAISSSLSGASGSINYSLTVDGETQSIDNLGNASIIASSELGSYVVELTATDSLGQSTTVSSYYTVTDGSDTTAPIATIHSPASQDLITSLSDIVVTANDDNIAQWDLYLISNSSAEQPQLVATGRGALINASAYSFDPSMLTNGLYKFQLKVTDTSGASSVDAIDMQVDGDLKVGNFTYTVNEFTVPLAGLPIAISRTYDSRRKSELGDFGYGWNLDYNLVKTEKSRPLGSAWQLNEFSSGPSGILRDFCVQPQGDVLVNVTLPNDEVERFTVKAFPECNQTVPVLDVELVFEPVGDTQSTLALAQTQTVRLVNGRLEILGSGETYDENDFVLTTREGYKYNFVANDDVTLVTDPNGNTLTFTDTGITHSSGKAITFAKDSEGKISSIKRPDNATYQYSYNSQDDLLQVRQPDFYTRENYTYNYQHGLLTIADSDGNNKVRNIYDDTGRLIAQEDSEGNRTSFDHDLAGRESVVTDRNGNVSFYYYDARGNVTSMVDALGNTSLYTFDANDNQLTETDPLNNVTTRTYNAINDLLSVTDPEGNTVSYTYNERGQEVTITDGNGNQYTNTYDSVGNLLTVEDPLENIAGNNINAQGLVTLMQDVLGNQTAFTYDTQGNKLTQVDPLGAETTYTYDDDNQVETETLSRTVAIDEQVLDTINYRYDVNGRLTRRSDAFGSIEDIDFDSLGNVRSHSFGNASLSFEYDIYNRIITSTLDGNSEVSTYDAEGNKLTETDRNENVTSYEYDALNRLVKTIYSDDSFTEIEYDAAGRVTKEIDARGNETEYGYDRAGRRTSMLDAQGNETLYEYDAQDNLVKETDALGRETTYTYDVLDRRTSMTLADSNVMSDAFDALGRNTGKTDQAGKTTVYEYDALSRLIKVTDALGQITQYEYDEAGNKIAQIDAEGRTTNWEYDQRGRITARVLPLGQRETFVYNTAGDVTSHTNFNGQTINYTYRLQAGRLTNVTGSGINEYYSHDANGNRTIAQNYVGRYNYQYDERNRLAKETQPDGTVLTYGYDAVGNKTSLSIDYENGDERTEVYAYDSLNRLTAVTDNDAQTTMFEYDAVGNQTHIRYPNGLVSISAFDTLNRVTSIITKDADDNVLTSYTYGLDATGRRSSLTEYTGRLSSFTYDDVYRLTQETITDSINGNHSSSYVYDLVGNRAQSTINGITTAFAYDSNDRLLTQGAYTYTYDDQGNMLTETDGVITKTYGYNANQRMTSFGDGTQSVAYEYNPDGIRISKNIDGTPTQYIVDSNRNYAQVVAEQNDADVIGKEYVFGYDLVSQNDATTKQYFHYDSLGTTRNLSDAVGSISDSYFYEAFGDLLTSDGSTDNDYLYTGEQYDIELDNYYLRSRYYNQNAGRFAQMDTWEGNGSNPITLNKYLYGNSDPLNFTDPTGNFSITELQVVNNIRTNMSNLQIDVGFSVLDSYLNPASAADNNSNNSLLLGLGAIGGVGSFKLMRLMSSKFRRTCNSFTGDTLVSTERGLRAIEDISIGDKVWSFDEEAKSLTLQLVAHLIKSEGLKELIEITVLNGEVISSTFEHPYYTLNKSGEWGWLTAAALENGHKLLTQDGDVVEILAVNSVEQNRQVFNLTVKSNHNYFVGSGKILTHNAGICTTNVNWKSVKSFGHAFRTHGAGSKNTRKLIDRARSTGNNQGQWVDNKKAADFLATLSHAIDTPQTVRIPTGLGQVISKEGKIVFTEWAKIIPSGSGIRTAYPVIK